MRVPSRRHCAALATTAAIAVSVPLIADAGPTSATANAAQAVTVAAGAPAPRVAKPTKALSAAQIRHQKAVQMRAKLVAFAKKKMRTGQYAYGAYSDNYFDCSGFTKLIYWRVAKIKLPHYSVSQWNRTKKVSKKNLLPGDLLFWGPGGTQHVSMYIGHGKMIGANNPRRDVVIESINNSYWRPRYAGAGRLIQG